MNNETFQQARSAYVSKQFDVALAKFTECLEDTSVEKAPGEVGLPVSYTHLTLPTIA